MKHRLDRRLAVAVTTYLLALVEAAHTRARGDRGEVVPALIIVAGFAALAVAFVLAVKGKVHSWITEIPNP